MWILKISLKDEKGIFSWRNKKFGVKSYTYRTGHYTKGNKIYVNAILLLEGKDNSKEKFIKSLKKDRYIKQLEVKGDLINCIEIKPIKISSKRKESVFYSLELIYLKPVFTNEEEILHN